VLPLLLAAYLLAAAKPVFDDAAAGSVLTRQAAGADPSWVERAIGRNQSAIYLNTPPGSATTLLETEFWNRNVTRVYNLGPGELCPLPETTTAIDVSTGDISPSPAKNTDYAVDSRGASRGTLVAVGGPNQYPLALYRIRRPLRVASTSSGVYSDGWMGDAAAFSIFGSGGNRRVHMTLTVGRAGWGGADVPGHVLILVGKPSSEEGQLVRIYDVRRWVLHRLQQRTFTFEARRPVRVEVHVRPTFSPSQFGLADRRQLGAQVAFRYTTR
jgi:hypothetical protein